MLHYDADFERIAEHSSLAFESVWIASAGTLDTEAADAPTAAFTSEVARALAEVVQ